MATLYSVNARKGIFLRPRSPEPDASQFVQRVRVGWASGSIACHVRLLLGQAGIDTVTRGKDGPLHIDIAPMAARQRADLDLWSARCNDPSAQRLRELHKVADGMPDVLRRANAVNTCGKGRASAGKRAADADEGAIATKPGQITQIDICTMPCQSLLGNNSAYDNYSTDFVFTPMRNKSDSVAATNQYYLDMKADGVDVDAGGTSYSDNEAVLNSLDMDERWLRGMDRRAGTPTSTSRGRMRRASPHSGLASPRCASSTCDPAFRRSFGTSLHWPRRTSWE